MRFLMLNWRDPKNPLSGGAERVSFAYLRALARQGHEVSWFSNEFPGCVREEVLDDIQVVRGGGRGTSVLAARNWYRRQARFDLVIDQHHGIPWYAPWWCRTNCIAYIHEVLGPIWEAFYSWPLSSIGRLQERWTHWAYRKVPFWTPSESTKKALHRNGVLDVTVIPNGCDTRPIPVLEPKSIESPLRLITVCRLAPNKRVDHAIRVVSLLSKRGAAVELMIVGTGEVEMDLRAQVEALGIADRVRFAGALPEATKNEALSRAHLLLHTSLREGWGLNVLEANAMGTPAVVYPVDGLRDSTISGETGWVTKTETPESVADELLRIQAGAEDYDRVRRAAWERSKQFQWEEVLPPACAWLETQAKRSSSAD